MLASQRDLTSLCIISLPARLLLRNLHFCIKWDYKDSDLAALVIVYFSSNLSPNVFPPEFPFFCHNDGSLRRSERTTAGDNDTIPVDGQPLCCPCHAPWRLMLVISGGGHCFFNSLKQNPSPARFFYWFGRPSVERWRTSKQYSPMSVIWWRWRRANLLQRPGRVRKSYCLSPGNHIYKEL